MSELDETLAEAQDALFENDFDRAVRLGELVLQSAPREHDAHDVVVSAHAARGAFGPQHAAVQRWCTAVGARAVTVSLRKHAIESAFLTGDRAALAAHAQSLLLVDTANGSARWFNTVCASAALLCGDVRETALASELQSRLTAESDEDVLLSRLVAAWLAGVDDATTARQLLRELALDTRDSPHFGYIAAWAEALRLLLGASDTAFAEELLARNIAASLSLQVAVALAERDGARLDALRRRHRELGSFGNVLPILRRRLVAE